MSAETEAVLLLAHGSPASLAELPAFLSRVRGGRPVSDQALAEYRERYEAIGGISPLTAITERIAAALADVTRLPVFVGMQHASPDIAEAVRQAQKSGIVKATAVCLTPYNSRMTVGAYKQRLDAVLADLAHPLEVSFV